MAYLDEDGYQYNSGFDRISARASVNVTPRKWFKTGLNINATHQNMLSSSGTDSDNVGAYTNIFGYCRYMAPIYPVHLHNPDGSMMLDPNGQLQYDPGQYTTVNEDGQEIAVSTRNQYPNRHCIWENELNGDKTVRNTIAATAYADAKFLNDFTFSIKGNISLRNSSRAVYNSAVVGDGQGVGRAKRTDYRYKDYTFLQQLQWRHTFADDHDVDVLLGHENYYKNYDYLYGFKTNETFAGKGFLSNFAEMSALNGYQNNYRTESYLARVRYNYKDRYNFEASFRRDGSSRFAKDSRWGNFGSVGANWIVSKEKWMESVKWVNNLKLRANWGQVGNDAGSGYYAYMSLYGSAVYNNQGAYYLTQLEANDLKWETGEAFGIAAESRLFDRWNLSIEYFDKRNKDLLFDVYQPLSAGATSSDYAESTVTRNLGTISNRGWEINTDVDIYRTRDWLINVGANATIVKNKVIRLPEQNKDGIVTGQYKVVEGKSRYEFYTYTFEGVDQMTGQSLYKADTDTHWYTMPDGSTVGNTDDGAESTENLTFINGKAYATKTTYAQREFHGSALPKVYGSFQANVKYRGLALSALFTYSLGGKTMDSNYQSLMGSSTVAHAMHEDVLGSWREAPAGMTETSPDRIDPCGIPMINSSQSSDNNAASSRWLTSSSYLVLKNLNLSYQLPALWAQKLDLRSIALSLSCENLFTCTARRGMNPQQSFSGTQDDYLVTPRVFTVGINVKF